MSSILEKLPAWFLISVLFICTCVLGYVVFTGKTLHVTETVKIRVADGIEDGAASSQLITRQIGYSFNHLPTAVEIEGSRGADLCALRSVDDSDGKSGCYIQLVNGKWMAHTADHANQYCEAICLFIEMRLANK